MHFLVAQSLRRLETIFLRGDCMLYGLHFLCETENDWLAAAQKQNAIAGQ
jgi:hypothetical protein